MFLGAGRKHRVMLMGYNPLRYHRTVQRPSWAQGKGRSWPGSSRAGSGGDGEGSVNQTELTRGWQDYRVPGKLLTNTPRTKQPSRLEG